MEDEINLMDYWSIIFKRKWIIIGIMFIFALIALIYSLNQPRLYRATGTIMTVDTGGGGLATISSLAPLLGGGGGGSELKLVHILKSATLANQVAANVSLSDFFPKVYKNQKMNEKEKIQEITEILQGSVNAINEGAGLMTISMIGESPEHSAKLANRYIEELGVFLNERSINFNFQIIDPAVPPKAKFKPLIRPNVMVGGIMGLFIGVFLSFFLEFTNKVRRT